MATESIGPVRFRIAGKKKAELRADKVEVGTRSNCALTLNDPVVAELHCTFAWKSGAFWITDGGSATGTFRNGVQVVEPVRVESGDHVVVGVTRLVLAIQGEGDASVLEITPDEANFFYKAKDRKEFKSDPDEWVRSEVRFGRIRIVRTLSWVALLGMVAFVVMIFATKRGERWLEPGTLSGTHGVLFARDPGALAVGENFGAARALAERDGCSVCHATIGGPKVENCATCHADLLESSHPFRAKSGAGDSKSDAELGADSCLMCHAGHQSQSKEELLAAARVVAHDESACKTCHPNAVPQSVSRPIATNAHLPQQDVPLVYDDFSHAAHIGAPWKIDCARCHTTPSANSDIAAATTGREFAVVPYSVCASCHDAKLVRAPGPDAPSAKMISFLESSPKKLVQSLDWHGTGAGAKCLTCHATLHQVAPRVAKADHYAWKHEIEPRDHQSVATAAGSACTSCHSDVAALAQRGAPHTAAFVHALHVSKLDPSAKDLPQVLEECARCHADVNQSASLGAQGGDRPPATLDACAKCHKDESGKNLVRSSTRGARIDVPRPEFPHDSHQKIAGGCLACHEFAAPTDGPNADAPSDARLKKGADNCAACHAQHANIEGGACALCHPWNSPSTHALLTNTPQSHPWPQMQFQHFSGKHGELTRTSSCVTCHTGMENAATIRAVSMPTGSSETCRQCHVQNRTWFHWR